jgi:hypothetical protein
MYLFKTWGPPTHKFMRRFQEPTREKLDEVAARYAEYDRTFWPKGRPALPLYDKKGHLIDTPSTPV